MTVRAYDADRARTYVYDLRTDRFLRISDGVSQWGIGEGAAS